MPNSEGKPQLVDLHKEDPDYRYDAEKTVKFILHTRLIFNFIYFQTMLGKK